MVYNYKGGILKKIAVFLTKNGGHDLLFIFSMEMSILNPVKNEDS